MMWSPTIIQQLCVYKYILSLKYEGKRKFDFSSIEMTTQES